MDSRDEQSSSRLTRKQLLQNSLAFGAIASVPGLLAACGGDETEASLPVEPTPAEPSTPPASTPPSETGAPAETGAAAGAPTPGGRIIVGMPIPSTDNLDPQNFVASGDKVRAFNVTERLAMINPDGTVKLHLAETVEPITQDATNWRVTLKSGITHSNGKDLTSADVISSFCRRNRGWRTRSIPTSRARSCGSIASGREAAAAASGAGRSTIVRLTSVWATRRGALREGWSR